MFFIALVVIACIMIIVMTNKEIKAWIKTTAFLFLSEILTVFVGWISWRSYCNGNHIGAIIACAIAIILAIAFVVIGLKWHKKKWCHVDSLI